MVNDDLSLGTLVSAEKHASTSVGCEATTTQEVSSHGLTRLHSLHSKILSHRFRNVVKIFACLDTLLGQQLDLCASSYKLAIGTLSDGLRLDVPILKPDLDGTFGHVDLLGNSLTDAGCRGWIFVELDL